jgi:hypothetical protein
MKSKTKLTELAELLEEHNFGGILFKKGEEYDYIVEETPCYFDTLYTQTKGVINSPAFFTELINEHTLRTFGPNRI